MKSYDHDKKPWNSDAESMGSVVNSGGFQLFDIQVAGAKEHTTSIYSSNISGIVFQLKFSMNERIFSYVNVFFGKGYSPKLDDS